MPLSNHSHQALLNSFAGNTSNFGALASGPTIHVGLSTTTPTMSGTNVSEPAGASYARVQTAAADWNSATDADPSVMDNATEITFPTLAAGGEDWGSLTHFVLYDAASGGNFLGYGALGTAKQPLEGDTPKFSAGDLDLQMQSPA